MKKIYHLFAFASVLLIMTACSEDNNNEKYSIEPPMFRDMTIKRLDGSSRIHAGEKFVVTMEHQSVGRNLLRGTYKWKLNEDVVASYHHASSGFVANIENSNPTDTLIIDIPGTYTISFSADYEGSGNNATSWQKKYGSYFSQYWEDNMGKVSYQYVGGYYYKYKVNAERKFTVHSAQ